VFYIDKWCLPQNVLLIISPTLNQVNTATDFNVNTNVERNVYTTVSNIPDVGWSFIVKFVRYQVQNVMCYLRSSEGRTRWKGIAEILLSRRFFHRRICSIIVHFGFQLHCVQFNRYYPETSKLRIIHTSNNVH